MRWLSDTPTEQMFKAQSPGGVDIGNNFKLTPQAETAVRQGVLLLTTADIMISLTLSCLRHFFSWVPLSDTVTPSLLGAIFSFAQVRDSETDVGALAIGLDISSV